MTALPCAKVPLGSGSERAAPCSCVAARDVLAACRSALTTLRSAMGTCCRLEPPPSWDGAEQSGLAALQIRSGVCCSCLEEEGSAGWTACA